MRQLSRRAILAAPSGLLLGRAAVAAEDGWALMTLSPGMGIAGSINGLAARLVLDSGAGSSFIDIRTAKRAGLTLGEPVPIHGWVRQTTGQPTEAVTVKFGRNSQVIKPIAVDFGLANHDPPVILGRGDGFGGRLIDFDFPGRRVAFHPRGQGFEPQEQAIRLARRGDGSQQMPITIAGRALWATIDLGGSHCLSIPKVLADRYGWLAGRKVSTSAAIGVDGLFTSQVATLDRVSVAGTELANMPVEILDPWIRGAPAVIGLGALRRFRMVWDFDGRRMWLTPDAAAIKAPFDKQLAGLGFRPERGELEVIHVALGSPAERAGFKTGDQVVAINGRPPASILSLPGKVGTRYSLTLAGGQERRLTLAEYY